MLNIDFELVTEYVTELHPVYGYPIGMKCEQRMEMVCREDEHYILTTGRE